MKTTFTLIFLFTCSFAFAQKNFVPGHYLTHGGEKVEVYINDLNWEKNPTAIEIKKDLNSTNSQKLGVADIKGFALSSGDLFESYVVDMDKSPQKLHAIELNAQPIIVRDTVFLRVIVKGNASLYFLKDEKTLQHYFIQKGDEVPVELINRITKQQKGNKTGYVNLPIYKGMLNAKLAECPAVSGKANKLKFKQGALKGIVEAYNQCTGGTQSGYVAEEEKMKLKIVAFGGATYNMLDINGGTNKALNETDFRGTSYTLGTSFISKFPRGRGKYAVLAEALYKSYKVDGSYGQPSNYLTETTFEMGYLGFNVMARYRLLDTSVKPYISAGLGNNFVVSDKSNQVIYTRTASSETLREKKPMNEIRKHEQALLLGFGVEVKRLQAEVRLESGNGFSPYSGVVSKNTSASLRLGYILK